MIEFKNKITDCRGETKQYKKLMEMFLQNKEQRVNEFHFGEIYQS